MRSQWTLVVMAACGRVGFDPLGTSVASDVGDDAVPQRSCSGLTSVCGAAGTSPCCDSRLVPGGTLFYRGYDVGTDNQNTDMTNPATVSDFRLDTYEVTVGRFRQFVNAGMGTQQNPPPAGAGARTLNGMTSQGGWDPTWNANLAADTAALVAAMKCYSPPYVWTDAPGTNEGLPLPCITWFDAFAFCVWDGGFLPTEAEFNYAAAGGSEQRAYPWSSPASSIAIDCSYANYQIDSPPGTYCVNGTMGGVNRVGSESPKGDGKWGQADLGGNNYEWMLDLYTTSYVNPCNDCAELTTPLTPIGERALRGGIYYYGQDYVRGAHRIYDDPARRTTGTGARCARTP